jgi:putative ABC transport system permease protein
MKRKRLLFNPWLWKMAWRDSRTHRKRLFLFMTSIVLGIAALVSIGSFGVNLESAVDEQAKTLLGADLMLSSLRAFTEETETLIDSIGGLQAREIMFGSMALFPKTRDTRLVQVRALSGEFPFYGAIGTEPPEVASTYQTGANALVDESIMIQFNAAVGDSIKIGARSYLIAGRLRKLPNEPPVASTFNPRVYLPAEHFDRTGLIQRGSLVNDRVYFKFEDDRNVEELVEAIQPHINRHRLRRDTVERRKENVGDALRNLYRFLNLVGFVALILGGLGVASAVHVYTKQKLGNASILRCLGAESKEAFLIYLIQVTAMSLCGSILGALLGIGIQTFLPKVLSDFLPVSIENFIAWSAVLSGVLIGWTLSFLFAMLPLLSIRKVSPLLALRASFEEESKGGRDKLLWLINGLIVIAVAAFAVWQSASISFGLGFAGAVFVAFGVLSGVAKLVTVLFKKFFPKSWSYVWRQGLANLYRPNNQTLVLVLSIGLGTFLITTLYLSQNVLLGKVTFAGGGNRPNLVLFDIQPDQKDELVELVRSRDLPVLQEAPMVTMRISSLNGTPVEEILNEPRDEAANDSVRAERRSRGLLRWEFRATYRDSLLDSEKIVAGTWQGRMDDSSEVVPISLEDGAAARLKLNIGDTLVWDVQGVPVVSRVTSLRQVDWQRIQANFMALFPQGALEYAPQIYILSTKTRTSRQSAEMQREIVRAFPNVSMIDLGLVLTTIENFLDKISFVIRFMAFFSIFTGLIVLAAAVITSRFQRIQESVLLRTLGATRRQVLKIMIVEYVLLGGFAALTGLLLSSGATYALAYFAFDSVFAPTILPFLVVLLSVIALTILIGMINSRGILDRPPLEVLRAEA